MTDNKALKDRVEALERQLEEVARLLGPSEYSGPKAHAVFSCRYPELARKRDEKPPLERREEVTI